MAAAAQEARRKEHLDALADAAIAREDAAAAAEAEEQRRQEQAEAERVERYKRAKAAEAERLAGIAEFEAGLRKMVAGLQAADKAGQRMISAGVRGPHLGRESFLRRMSLHLMAGLSAVSGSPAHFGQIRYSHTGAVKTTDPITQPESDLLANLVEEVGAAPIAQPKPVDVPAPNGTILEKRMGLGDGR